VPTARLAWGTWVACAAAAIGAFGCTGTTIVRARPPDAHVVVDGRQLDGNAFQYGRWIGNEVHVQVSAAGYATQERTLDVHVGQQAGLIAIVSPLVGLFALPWNGEIADEVYFDLVPERTAN
jgi:hypothetical protein